MKAGPRTPAAVCTFWLRDACTRGDTCKFLHERPRATPVPVDAPPATPAVPTVASAAVATEPVRRASQLQQQPRPVAAGRYARLKAPGPLIDIGLNITHKDLYDRDALLQSAVDASVVACVCTGTSLKGSAAGVRMLKGYRGPMQLACTVGIHPHDAKTFEGDKSVAALRALAVDNPQLVKAIGECGLDYDRMFSTRDDQLACFSAQLRLAVELDLPVFLHQRLGFDDFCAVMDREWPADRAARACVHCFTGDGRELARFVARGYMIGLTGLVCDTRRSSKLREAIRKGALPLDRLMLETDAPFCTPKCIPNAPRRCEVEMVTYVAQDVADLMGVPFVDVCEATTRNARAFFTLAPAK